MTYDEWKAKWKDGIQPLISNCDNCGKVIYERHPNDPEIYNEDTLHFIADSKYCTKCNEKIYRDVI
jgi:hypothetical protein